MRRTWRVRTRIFIACEGESEVAFRAWLQDLCDEHELFVHLVRGRVKGGGDPLVLVQGAIRSRREDQKKHGGHRHSVLFIDTDRLDDRSRPSQQAVKLAEDAGLALIRQVPCFEGVLLRLHPGHKNEFPVSAKEAERRLRQLWPDYSKPMTRPRLAAHFVFTDLQRLAQVDGEIRRLMEILGLPQLR